MRNFVTPGLLKEGIQKDVVDLFNRRLFFCLQVNTGPSPSNPKLHTIEFSKASNKKLTTFRVGHDDITPALTIPRGPETVPLV